MTRRLIWLAAALVLSAGQGPRAGDPGDRPPGDSGQARGVPGAAPAPDPATHGYVVTRAIPGVSNPTLDSDDYIAIIQYLQSLPYVDADAVGTYGVSHSGELMLKAASQITFGAAVPNEGAAHEFLGVDTGPSAPRVGTEIQHQDIEVVRKNARKPEAMARIARIRTPFLHLGRDDDHLQGIFKLTHERIRVPVCPEGRVVPAGRDSAQGIRRRDRFFDKHLKHVHRTSTRAR